MAATESAANMIYPEALALFESGCLSAAESLLEQAHDREGSLHEEIRRLRDETRNSVVEFSSDALGWEMSKLLVASLTRQSRGGEPVDEDFVRIHMLGDDDEQRRYLQRHDRTYTALYVESANGYSSIKYNMLRPDFQRNDRATGWLAVQDGLRRCPFVTLWHGKLELNDATVYPPHLVRVARLTFDPRSEEDDRINAEAILREMNEAVEEDIPTIRWWAAFLQIDAKRWLCAQEVIKAVIVDCVHGVWPAYYLPEALFLASMAEFGLDNRKACDRYLASYFDLASPMDRNRADATLLHLWARDKKPPRPPTLQCLCTQQLLKMRAGGENTIGYDGKDLLDYWNETESVLYEGLPKLRKSLSNAWDEHTFAECTWLRKEVSRQIGFNEVDPFLPLYEHIESSWNRIGWRPSHVDRILQRLKTSCGRTITIRHISTDRNNDDRL